MPSISSKDLAELRPSQDWTFEHALLLLQHEKLGPRRYRQLSQCLDEFLNTNKDVYTDGHYPFLSTGKQTSVKFPKKLTVNNVQYDNNLSESTTRYATLIGQRLSLDPTQVLRIMITASRRIPVEGSIKLISSDDGDWIEGSGNSELVCYYTGKVMREQRTIIRTCFLLVKNDIIANACDASASIALALKQKSIQLFGQQLDAIEFITNQLKHITKNDPLDRLICREYALTLLDILNYAAYLSMASSQTFAKQIVVRWFKLMQRTAFMSDLGHNDIMNTESSATIEALCTIITIVVLDLDSNYGSSADPSSFLNDPSSLRQLNDYIAQTSVNPLIIYAWGIILHRKYTILSIHADSEEAKSFIAGFGSLKSLQDLYITFASQAATYDVSRSMHTCFELIKYDEAFCDVLGSFVVAFVPYVKMTDSITSGMSEILRSCSNDVVSRFFENPATEDMLTLSRAKLPLSMRSFVALVSINSHLASEEFRSFSSFMKVLKDSDFSTKYAIDDTNPNLVRLIEDVDVLPPYEASNGMSLQLKKGTKAQLFPLGGKTVITDSTNSASSSVAVAFLHQYSGWAMLGREMRNLSTHLDENKEKLALLTQIFILLTKVFKELEVDEVEDILTLLNSFTGQNDIIDIWFRIYDQLCDLHAVKALTVETELMTALCGKGYSFRIWAYIFKSKLLGLEPGSGYAATIHGTCELVSGDYSFTISLLNLATALTRDSMLVGQKVTANLRSQVLARFLQCFVHLFSGFLGNRYVIDHQKPQIGALALRLFDMVLTSLYGLDETQKPSKRINGIFWLAAKCLTDGFLETSSINPLVIDPIISFIKQTSTNRSDCVSNDLCGYWNYRWFHNTFQFSSTLIKVRSVIRTSTASAFEMSLCTHLPNLVEIYLNNMDKRQVVIDLLTDLADASWGKEAPSFLTHLRHTHAQILLRCLSIDLANRAELYTLKDSLYDFFSSVIRGGQQGLSIVFITGKDVKDSFHDIDYQKKVKSFQYSSLSLLNVMKKDVAFIHQYPANVALHLADAIALAFGSWTSAEQQSDDTEFIKQLLSKLDDYPDPQLPEGSTDADYIDFCYEVSLLSKVAEILSLYLFVSRDRQDKNIILTHLNRKQFIQGLASKFCIVGYKASLQDYVESRFHKVWPDYKLSQFAISHNFKQHHFGSHSVYSFELLDPLLGENPKWPAVREQIINASVNLQYCQAQASAAKAFGALITCLCKAYSSGLNVEYLQLVTELLRICDEDGIPVSRFEDVYRTRIELCFYICYSFSQKKQFTPPKRYVFDIISCVSRLLCSSTVDLTQSLTSVDVTYYKPLLRILLICLQMSPNESDMITQYSATFSDIFSDVICHSIKVLFHSIKARTLSVPNSELGSSSLVCKQIEDVILITAILKAFLSLNLPESLEKLIANAVINTGCFRSISSMYGVSHRIKVSGQEVFADYSLMLLCELSSDRLISETMVRNGLFRVIIESPMSVRIQAGNARPYPLSRSRLQHLWSGGLLPIVLSLLGFFGDAVLADSCLFATSFTKQINSTIQAWFEADSMISTQSISETSEIILLAKALTSLDAYNYIRNSMTAEMGDGSVVLVPGLDTDSERRKFSNALSYLIAHPKYLTLRIVPSSAEEQRELQSEDNIKFIEKILQQLKDLKASVED